LRLECEDEGPGRGSGQPPLLLGPFFNSSHLLPYAMQAKVLVDGRAHEVLD
jgi:hypothetical protein